MRNVLLVLALAVLSARAFADPKIDDTSLADADKLAGYVLSAHGLHTGVLVNKGSRFAVAIDGTEGPKIDGMLSADGKPFVPGVDHTLGRPIPVVFSDDGVHSAYFARSGEEFFLVADGKEIYRAKYTSGLSLFVPLTVTAKHVFFGGPTPAGRYAIFADGTAGPESHVPPKLAISPDGNHFAYVGTEADGHDTPWAVVDGKQVKHFGDDLQFTSKGHLLAVLKAPGASTLNIDNKAVLKAGNIQQVWTSPGGGMIAAWISPRQGDPAVLTVNGKIVPGTEKVTISALYFSPDDKHFAVLVGGGNPQYVIIDGKKGDPYQMIPGSNATGVPGQNSRAWAKGMAMGTLIGLEASAPPVPAFTADSSKFLYVGMNGQKFVLVANDDESDPLPNLFSPAISADGNHYGYVSSFGTNGKMPAVVIDGKTLKCAEAHVLGSGALTDLLFSPDGTHTCVTSGDALYLDGKYQAAIASAGPALYSPDSQHLLLLGHDARNDTPVLYLDGKALVTGAEQTNIFRPTFSADSKHLFWMGHRAPSATNDLDSGVLWVDGKATPLHFNETDIHPVVTWEAAADGTLTFVARTTENLHKYHVTPEAAAVTAAK